MNIEPPKDAEGREIPLDTKVLYDEDGNAYEVARYTYSVRQTIPRRKWEAVMLDSRCRYVSNLHITPPTPPDSWEKLEEDLNNCSVSTRYVPCAYFSDSTDSCEKCPANPNKECIVQMVKHLALRIHKLRGED